MERKLLSLPSFFVLLLIAGIAFLAAPVEDVHADAPTVESISGPSTVQTSSPFNVVVTLSEAVDHGADSTTDAEFLQPKDFTLTLDPSVDSGESVGVPVAITAGLPSAATAPAVAYAVPITVPANYEGTITLVIAEDAAFQATTGDQAYVAPTTAVSGAEVAVDLKAPTVTIALATGVTGTQNGPFEVIFTLSEAPAATGAGVFVADDAPVVAAGQTATPPTATTGDVTVTGGEITQQARNAGTNVWRAIITPTPSTADAKTTEVSVSVAEGVFQDAAGNNNDASDQSETDSGDQPLTVAIDNDPPTVSLAPAGASEDDGFTNRGTLTAGIGNFKIRVTIEGRDGDDEFDASEDLHVGDGSVSGTASPDPSTLEDDYIVTIAQDNSNATPTVQIQVPEGAIMDNAGNGNTVDENNMLVTLTVNVSGGASPVDPGTQDEDTGEGEALTGAERGFKFPLPAMPVPTADGSNRFVVLAKASNGSPDNGLSIPTVTGVTEPLYVDIDDDAWEDLADFLAYNGGAIALIGPTGTSKNDLIISEIMWGRDDGLSDPTKSQWIELYNAKSIKDGAPGDGSISAGEWKIQFHAGPGPSIQDNNLSDAFSNRQLGNAHWDIPNQAGGKYGQSGRTKITVGVAGALRDLVSMRRKIDYAKVEKTDHKTGVTDNRTEQEKGIPDGALAGSWEASTSRVNMSGTRKGTPGAEHVVVVGTSGISKSVVFNEIANRSNKKFDWIELYNPGSSDVKINNWVLSKVTGVDKDDELVKFESDENIVVPAKGFLLVVNEDPSETALSAGKNVDNPNSRANSLPTEVYIDSGLDIPKDKFLLILRTESKLKSHEKIVDIAGHLAGLSLVHTGNATELWPLRAWKKIKEDDLLENNDKTWVRDKGKDLYHGDAWKSDGGFTGLGIDRNPDSDEGPTSGTPGFDNGAVKDKVKDLTEKNPVVISEIMFGTGNGRDPQWIELYNPSETQAVKLHNWRLEVQNTTIDRTETLNVEYDYTLILPDKRIQPKQTILIVSASAREATRDRFPSDRIINIWSTRTLRETVEMTSARDAILSSVAFYIKLSDHEKQVVDEVGNIVRARDARDWDLPGGNLEDGGRASMLRREATFGDGTEADAWISAAVVDPGQKVGINELYYGNEDDVGTPGYRAGGPLPVQLSSFYSKRNDTGAVVITWSTESELDNAGFNILRSQSRTGEFVRINAQLIPGAGTTGEKSAYTWTDTSAKPNVLYFYQIEDVSLAGDHRTLRTTRLRGHIGAAGKATTTWGDLKSRE